MATYKTRDEINTELKRAHGSSGMLRVIRDWRSLQDANERPSGLGDFFVAWGACPVCKGAGVFRSPEMLLAERCECRGGKPHVLERETRLGLNIDYWYALADRQRARIEELEKQLASEIEI